MQQGACPADGFCRHLTMRLFCFSHRINSVLCRTFVRSPTVFVYLSACRAATAARLASTSNYPKESLRLCLASSPDNLVQVNPQRLSIQGTSMKDPCAGPAPIVRMSNYDGTD